MDPIDLEIGARLRVLREWRGETLTRLARAVGADPLELERYDAGAAPVSLLVKLAEALGASADILIVGAPVSWRKALDDLAREVADGSVEAISAFFAIPDERVRRAFLDPAWTIVDAQGRSEPDS